MFVSAFPSNVQASSRLGHYGEEKSYFNAHCSENAVYWSLQEDIFSLIWKLSCVH